MAGKLILAGYCVWYDLERLNGGDYFWNKIEEAIRNQSIRMIAIISEISNIKDGVRNEWELGIILEKEIQGFLIPVRLDDFNLSNLPITIGRKNVIDFYKGWHFGLAQLIDTLDKSNIHKSETIELEKAKLWLPTLPEKAITLVDHGETLESNWLQILSLPVSLETTRILGNNRRIPITEKTEKLPWLELGDKIIGFAPRKDLVSLFNDIVALKEDSAVLTSEFIDKGIYLGQDKISLSDARNRVTTLIRQAWDLKMNAIGLKPYELSNHRLCWYVPKGLLLKDKIHFYERNGNRRTKNLSGTSTFNKVNWHYGVCIHPLLNDLRRIEVTAHIIFTDLDNQLISSTKQMHSLRRRFCTNWWNDRWRGMLRAFLSFISEGKDKIYLPVGGNRNIEINSLPMCFNTAKGLSDLENLIADEEIKLEENVEFQVDDYQDDEDQEDE